MAIELLDNIQRLMQQRTIWFALKFDDKPDNKILTIRYIDNVDEPVTAGMIAEHLDIKPSSVTQIVNQLVDAGFVERIKDTDDARVTIIQLTDAGRQAVSDHAQFGSDFKDMVFEPFDETEIATFNQLLTKLNDHLASDAFETKMKAWLESDIRWTAIDRLKKARAKMDQRMEQLSSHIMRDNERHARFDHHTHNHNHR
ncbi:MAG: MarR family winged helix-turn-helix transcriptional regulator [Lactobacillaceae bacterium]|jgi:DNA-binding MarR family transcriptional regulator|nr:MarR family winged helix-turn-helix transcriptional regulator [Lactobacillaceae bacterium]